MQLPDGAWIALSGKVPPFCAVDGAEGAEGVTQPVQVMGRFARYSGVTGFAEELGEVLQEGFFRTDAFQFFNQNAFLVEQHRRRARDLRIPTTLCCIEHEDIHPGPKGLGYLEKNGAGKHAGTAVLVEEIQDDKTPGFQDFPVRRGQR